MTHKPQHDQVTGLSMEKQTMPKEIYLLHNEGNEDETIWCDHVPNNEMDSTQYIRLKNNPDYIITKKADVCPDCDDTGFVMVDNTEGECCERCARGTHKPDGDALEALNILWNKAKAGASMECPDPRLGDAIEDKLTQYYETIRQALQAQAERED